MEGAVEAVNDLGAEDAPATQVDVTVTMVDGKPVCPDVTVPAKRGAVQLRFTFAPGTEPKYKFATENALQIENQFPDRSQTSPDRRSATWLDIATQDGVFHYGVTVQDTVTHEFLTHDPTITNQG